MLKRKPLPVSPLFATATKSSSSSSMSSSSSSFSWLTIKSSGTSTSASTKINKKTATLSSYQCLVSVRVTPGSKKDQLIITDTELQLKISAPPVDGKANEAVVSVFEEILKNSRSSRQHGARDVQLVSGMTSRSKVIQFTWVSTDRGGEEEGTTNNVDTVTKCVVDMFRDAERDGI